jgi:hypothetical protein
LEERGRSNSLLRRNLERPLSSMFFMEERVGERRQKIKN